MRGGGVLYILSMPNDDFVNGILYGDNTTLKSTYTNFNIKWSPTWVQFNKTNLVSGKVTSQKNAWEYSQNVLKNTLLFAPNWLNYPASFSPMMIYDENK